MHTHYYFLRHELRFSPGKAVTISKELRPRVASLACLSHQLGRYREVEATPPPHIQLAYDGLV